MTDPRTTTPIMVRSPMGATVTEIDWADGTTSRLENAVLRGYCPCAGCQGHSGEIKFIRGNNADIATIDEVGSYALCFAWGDGHSSGIYSFRYLRTLGDLVQRTDARPDVPRAGTA